jgi:hypothetical protein
MRPIKMLRLALTTLPVLVFALFMTGCPHAQPYAPPAGTTQQYCVYPIAKAPEGADYAVGTKICNHCKHPDRDNGCKVRGKFKVEGPKGTFEYEFGAPDEPNCGTCPGGGVTVEVP